MFRLFVGTIFPQTTGQSSIRPLFLHALAAPRVCLLCRVRCSLTKTGVVMSLSPSSPVAIKMSICVFFMLSLWKTNRKVITEIDSKNARCDVDLVYISSAYVKWGGSFHGGQSYRTTTIKTSQHIVKTVWQAHPLLQRQGLSHTCQKSGKEGETTKSSKCSKTFVHSLNIFSLSSSSHSYLYSNNNKPRCVNN